MESNQASLSILMLPWLAHGHVFPYLELAKNLTKHNFTIFFCSTPIILQSLPLDHRLPITLVPLHLPSPPELPPDLHTTKHAPTHLMTLLHETFYASKAALSTILASISPNIFIYDFQTWAAEAAAANNIPAVHFATCGAAAHLHLFFRKDSLFPFDATYLRPHDWKAPQATTSDLNLSQELPHFARSRDVILMKTSRGIEEKYLDYLSLLCNKIVVPMGPLITLTTTTATTTTTTETDIMDWLRKKERLSTIYISFGSENYLSKKQMEEMAKGLEASRANFIWVVRFPLGEREEEKEMLPLGFVERVGERGKIVKGWAPQAKILSHENVCGFISHCGMSSTIESVYFGVPVIGVPLKQDQPLNSRVLVEAGVCVEVARDESGDFRGDDVAAAIGRVVEGGGEEMRARPAGMRETMRREEECAGAEAAAHLRRICMEGFVEHDTIEKKSLASSFNIHVSLE